MIHALPDLLSTSLFSRVTSDIRANLDRNAIEAVTGRKSDVTAATGGRNGQLHRVQMAIDDSQATQTRLALMTGRYTQAGSSLKTIRNATKNIATEAIKVTNASSSVGLKTMVKTAQSTLGVVFSALNARYDGRALFGGDDAAPAPLGDVDKLLNDISTATAGAATTADKKAAIDAYFAPGGGFDTAVYGGGDDDAAKVVLPDGFEVPAIGRADDSGFRNLIKGLAMLSESPKLPPVDLVDWVRQGANIIRGAQEEVMVEEAQIALSLNRIDEAVEREKSDLSVARETLNRVIGRDAAEAASETQNLENRLKAAYTLTGRLGRLSLTDYLR